MTTMKPNQRYVGKSRSGRTPKWIAASQLEEIEAHLSSRMRTVAQIATDYGVSARTVYSWIRRGLKAAWISQSGTGAKLILMIEEDDAIDFIQRRAALLQSRLTSVVKADK